MLSREIQSPTIEEQEIQRSFADIMATIKTSGLDCRIVGGVAVLAYLQEERSFYRSTGSLRDLDIIALTQPQELETISNLQKSLAEIATRHPSSSPPVNIHPTYPENHRRPSPLPQLLRQIILQEDGHFALQYGEIKVAIPPETLSKLTIVWNGQELPTVPPATLLHLYLTRGAYFKPKDVSKLMRLARFVKENPDLSPPHRTYGPFHQFVREVRRTYPWRTKTYQFINWLDAQFDGQLTHNQFFFGHWDKV